MIIILAFCGTKQGKLSIHNGNSYQPASTYITPWHWNWQFKASKISIHQNRPLFLCFLFGTSLLPHNLFAITNPFTFGSTPRTSQLCTHKRSFHKTASLSDGATGIIEKNPTIQIRQESEVTRQLNPITSEKDIGRMGMTLEWQFISKKGWNQFCSFKTWPSWTRTKDVETFFIPNVFLCTMRFLSRFVSEMVFSKFGYITASIILYKTIWWPWKTLHILYIHVFVKYFMLELVWIIFPWLTCSLKKLVLGRRLSSQNSTFLRDILIVQSNFPQQKCGVPTWQIHGDKTLDISWITPPGPWMPGSQMKVACFFKRDSRS